MGCDVHVVLEVRPTPGAPWELRTEMLVHDHVGVDSPPLRTMRDLEVWAAGRPLDNLGYLDARSRYDRTNNFDTKPDPAQWDEPFDNRNYALFGVLAGVRREPPCGAISPPRGWPDDASPLVQRWRNSIDHTPSWLSVADIDGYPHWDAPGVPYEFTLPLVPCRKHDRATSYAAWVHNKQAWPNTTWNRAGDWVITEAAANELLAALAKRHGGHKAFYAKVALGATDLTKGDAALVRCCGAFTLREDVGEEFWRAVDYARSLVPGRPEDARFIFHFDS